jgi:hypothetical protein
MRELFILALLSLALAGGVAFVNVGHSSPVQVACGVCG